MVCTTKQAASALAHKRWGTKPTGHTTKRKRKSSEITITEKEKVAPGVKERRKSNQPSTHFEDTIKYLESKAQAMDAADTSVHDLKRLGKKKRKKMGGTKPMVAKKKPYVKKASAKSKGMIAKPKLSGKINILTPRRK